MAKTRRGYKPSCEWEVYRRHLRTPRGTRQIGKESQTIQFQEARRDIVYIDREENHLLYTPLFRKIDFLSLCSENKFDLLTKEYTLFNDAYDVFDNVCDGDDKSLNNDDIGKGCQSNYNIKYHPKYNNKCEDKMYQYNICNDNAKFINVNNMMNDKNKTIKKYLNNFINPQITKEYEGSGNETGGYEITIPKGQGIAQAIRTGELSAPKDLAFAPEYRQDRVGIPEDQGPIPEVQLVKGSVPKGQVYRPETHVNEIFAPKGQIFAPETQKDKGFVPKGQVFVPETRVDKVFVPKTQVGKVFVPKGQVFVPETQVDKVFVPKGQVFVPETQLDKVFIPKGSHFAEILRCCHGKDSIPTILIISIR